jgi:hypothetical protein
VWVIGSKIREATIHMLACCQASVNHVTQHHTAKSMLRLWPFPLLQISSLSSSTSMGSSSLISLCRIGGLFRIVLLATVIMRAYDVIGDKLNILLQ